LVKIQAKKGWSNFGQNMVNKGSSFEDELCLNFILGK
jgi:hypothetical protein